MKIISLRVSILALTALLLNVASSHGTLLYYDGFDYTAGTTVGTASGNGPSGGSGWGNMTHWYDNSTPGANVYNIASSGLSYGTLATSGNALSQNTDTIGALRTFNNNQTTSLADGTYFVSFLFSTTGNSTSTVNQYAGLQFGGAYLGLGTLGTTGSTTRVLVDGAGYATNTVSTGITVEANQTYLLVAKIDFTAAANGDSISLWVNPTSSDLASAGTAQAINTSVNLTGLTSANFYSSSTLFGMTVDELRIGSTWGDVTPGLAIPEPSAYALFITAIGLLLLGARRRYRYARLV